jgi:hypothetical protein
MAMKRKSRILLIVSLLFFGGLAAAYGYAWHYGAQLIRKQILALYDDAAKVGMRIDGDFPTVTGFPGPHVVRFSGRLTEGDAVLNLPDLRVRGLFLPGYTVTVSLPQGASLGGAADPAVFSLNDLDIRASIPLLIPASLNAEDLAVWQRNGGVIHVTRFYMRKESLTLNGKGDVTLDAQLQPAGAASVQIKGYIEFIDWLKSQGLLKDKSAMITGMVLTGLSRTDSQTGETYIKTDLKLKDRRLYVGPMGILTLPPVAWASRQQPAPLQ